MAGPKSTQSRVVGITRQDASLHPIFKYHGFYEKCVGMHLIKRVVGLRVPCVHPAGKMCVAFIFHISCTVHGASCS